MGKQQQTITSTQNFKKVIQEGAAQLEQATQEAKHQVVDAVVESKTQLLNDAQQFNSNVQEQLQHLKEDVQRDILQRLGIIQTQLRHSKKDFSEFGGILKQEFAAILQALTQIGQGITEDVGELSSKHKTHLIATFRKTTTHTKTAWEKVKQDSH